MISIQCFIAAWISRTTYPFWRTAPKMRLMPALLFLPCSLDLDACVLGDLLPGRDVAGIDVALLVAGDELRCDAEPQKLLLHPGVAKRVLERRLQFLCDRRCEAGGRIHRPGQAAVERHALFLVAGDIRQARRALAAGG